MGHLWNIRQFLNCARVQEFANNDDDQVTKTRVYAGILEHILIVWLAKCGMLHKVM